MHFTKFLTLLLLLFAGSVIAQPVNDFCENAILLNVETSCVQQNFSNFDATAEPLGVAPNPACGFYAGGDVWFQIVVPASGQFRVETVALSAGTVVYQLYTGICGAFTPVGCSVGGTNYNNPALGGETLYLRVFRQGSSAGIDFSICVWEIDVPANDNCADAIPVVVGNSCSTQNYSCIYTTAQSTAVAVNPTCGFFDGGDVWFTFQAPASGQFRVETVALSAGTVVYQLYTGICGAFTPVGCSVGGTNYNNPALGGETLYLRVFRQGSSAGIDFSICVWEIDVPANDNCADAIPVVVGNSCSTQNYSCIYTTAQSTAVAVNPTCGFFDGGDVWFTFQAPASGAFRIESTALSAGDVSYQLYTGTCGGFTNVSCSGGITNYNSVTLGGQTIYLRVFRFNNRQGVDFSLCIWEIPAHENDNCSGALNLTVGNSCTMQTYSSIYQTTETGIAPNPGCVGYSGGDVWFKFTMPASGKVRIERNNIADINAQFALYTGSCGSFSNLACAQLTNALNINQPSLGGQEIYIRVYDYGSTQGGTFELCVWEPPTPDNDFCANAIHLPVGFYCQMQTFSNAYCTTEVGIAPNPGCVGYSGGDIWFTFDMPASGQIQIQRNNISNVNAQWAVYQGTCGAMTNVACAQLVNQLNINNPALAGQTLYLRVYNYGSVQGGTFEICITDIAVPENDFCSNAIALPVNATCEMQTYSNINCTAEAGVNPASDCLGYTGGDVWFTMLMPSSGRLRIERNNIFEVNAQLAVYQGDCASLTEVACAQLTNLLIIQDSTLAGETMYLRVFNYGSAQGGVFELCVSEADCNGDADGGAFYDGCGTCVGGNTGLEACLPDCNGDFGGTAYLDECEICVGGNTGLAPCILCNIELSGSSLPANTGFADGSATVIISGGAAPFQIQWNDALQQSGATASGLFSGIYTVTVVDANNCELSLQVEVGENYSGPVTRLRPEFCGNAYEFGDVISSVFVAGAQDYRWKLTPVGGSSLPEYTRGSNNRNLRLSWVSGIQLGVEYEVLVKVKVAGVWGNYSVMCTIFTESYTPDTYLLSNYSPLNPLSSAAYSLCDNIRAEYVYVAAAYQWEFAGTDTLYAQSPSYFIQLGNVLNIGMNTIYQVRVRALVDGQWGDYNIAKPIQLGLPANTSVWVSHCNTVRATSSNVAAYNVCASQNYMFRFQHDTEPERLVIRPTYVCPFNTVVPALTPGETYSVSVRVKQGGIEGDYSNSCSITIAGPQAEITAGEVMNNKSLEMGTLGIFPNPNTGDEVRVDVTGLADGYQDVSIVLYDIYGKQISVDSFGQDGPEMSYLLRFKNALATGLYLVQVNVDGKSFAIEKLIVK
jgi:hypothetical protein